MSEFWAFSWILIPLAAILAGAFKEWLQFKQTQSQLGTSTNNLEKKVESLEKALEHSESRRSQLIERIQNLETIVTSTEWDSLDDHVLRAETSNEKQKASSLLAEEIPQNPDGTDSTNRAARLARRLNS